MSYFKRISISLSPNVQKDDLKVALSLIIRPWLWKNGKHIKILEDDFKKYLPVKYAFSFNSGRSAFYAILKSLELQEGSQVALQAFTCNALPNPILWANLQPIYVDCDKEDFNLSVSDLDAKMRPNTKAVVVQHTFGLPANMDQIRAFCSKHDLILIEDCAHSLGAEFSGIKVGSHSKAAFFSFSRDKVISSVYGGMAVTNDDTIAKNLERMQKEFGMPSGFWIFQQLLHPIVLHYVILPIYSFLDLGKIFLVLSQTLHILSKAVSFKEKRGQKPDYFPKALPNALAVMARNQFNKLEILNKKRAQIAEYYFEQLKDTKFNLPKKFPERKNVYLRFSVTIENAHQIIYDAWSKQNILIGDWYTSPIAPDDTKLGVMHYQSGSCQNAEELSKITLNLPTHINMKKNELDRIIDFLKKNE